ncbi:MAG: hypothetical protein IJC77_04220 [Bacteroidaceae bacterium]|nr:hypothetical protein [Bacteroidaceae bacterium]
MANSEGYSGSITIPSTATYGGVSYSVMSIGQRAFSDCSSLTSITISSPRGQQATQGNSKNGDRAIY